MRAPARAPGRAARRPWRQEDRDLAIAQAIAFINERLRMHRFRFCLEVGGYLMDRLFRGDTDLFRRATWKQESIHRIARDRRVGLSEDLLYACIHIAVLVRRFGEHAPGIEIPELPIWAWDALWCLEPDPPALVEVAQWAERTGASVDDVERVARILGPYLAAGGRLEDLLADATVRAEDNARRCGRLLDVTRSWLVEGERLDRPARERVVELAEQILAALPGPAAGRRSGAGRHRPRGQ